MASGGAALAERVLAGDRAEIERLTAAGWPRLGGALPSGLDAADLRQEAAQELVMAAREASSAGRPGAPADGDADARFEAEAVARVRRRLDTLVHAERRRRARLAPLAEAALRGGGAGEPSPRLSAEVESPRLAGALARLSPRLRALLTRIYWQELSAAEVAAQDGIAPAAVRHARQRAEAALRRHMEAAEARARLRRARR